MSEEENNSVSAVGVLIGCRSRAFVRGGGDGAREEKEGRGKTKQPKAEKRKGDVPLLLFSFHI